MWTHGSRTDLPARKVITAGMSALLLATPGAAGDSEIDVVNSGNNTIGKYTISGCTANVSRISGLGSPYDMAVSGSDICVVNENRGNLGGYTTSIAPVSAAFVSGLDNHPYDIAVTRSAVPEPSAIVMMGLGSVGWAPRSAAVGVPDAGPRPDLAACDGRAWAWAGALADRRSPRWGDIVVASPGRSGGLLLGPDRIAGPGRCPSGHDSTPRGRTTRSGRCCASWSRSDLRFR